MRSLSISLRFFSRFSSVSYTHLGFAMEIILQPLIERLVRREL